MEGRRHARRAHQEVIAVARAQTPTHYHLRRRVLIILLATALMSVLCTVVVFLSERHAQATEIHDLFDAFIFSTSQLLTASSVASPQTDFGKVLELFFDLWAITVVATLAGSFGAFFHARSKELEREAEERLHRPPAAAERG
jgi:ABC-type phosphate/phosphonate transport system permease subunit